VRKKKGKDLQKIRENNKPRGRKEIYILKTIGSVRLRQTPRRRGRIYNSKKKRQRHENAQVELVAKGEGN